MNEWMDGCHVSSTTGESMFLFSLKVVYLVVHRHEFETVLNVIRPHNGHRLYIFRVRYNFC